MTSASPAPPCATLMNCPGSARPLETEIRDAVFGNAGSIIAFRASAADASYVAREFSPTIEPDDFIRLPKYSIYPRVMIDGETSKPFSAKTFASVPEVPGWEVPQAG